MAQNKFADLPGIMMGESDVYETSDLPESDQNMIHYEESTDSVETLHISANEAFGKFKGKNLDSGNVDFSDKLRNSRRKGYIVWSGDEQQPEETPVKKYQRLNCEVRELLDQIGAQKAAKPGDGQSLEAVTAGVENLHKQLMGVRLEEVLGREVLDTMTDPQAAARKKLLMQLDQLRATDKSHKTVNKDNNIINKDNNDKFSYELFLKPETSKLQQESLIASLESRLSILEHAVGQSPEKMSILAMETNQKSLAGAVNVLAAKTALLDPNHLDHVEGRLAALQHKLTRLSDSKSSLDTAESKSKLDELYDVATKSSAMYATLPEVIDRLEALQTIHCRAAEFTRSLTELESVQRQMVVELGNDSALLKETQEKFKENLGNIEANFASLDARLEALKK